MSFIQWRCERGAKSHVANEISGRGRRSRDEKGNQGVGDFRFINIIQFFSIYDYYFLSFFSILFLPTTFNYPHPHPRPTTSTHYPRPTTFSYTHVRRDVTKTRNGKRGTRKWKMRTKPNPTLGALGGHIKRRGLYPRGLQCNVFFCLQVDGPINFWQGGRGGGEL